MIFCAHFQLPGILLKGAFPMAYIINNNRIQTSRLSGGWMNRRAPFWRAWVKSITLLVSASFVFPYMAFAFEAATYPVSSGKLSPAIAFTANGKQVEVANDLGRVVSSFHGKSGKTVIYIHDLHCNYEVQSNIAALLNNLEQKNGLVLVGVEGESKAVNVARLATFPQASVKNNVGQYFLKRGRITGAEYLAATGKQPLQLEGIEDQALYDQNKNTLLKFLSEEAQGYCEDLKNIVEKLKVPLYSTDLAKLDHFREQFEGETISLETYCQFLLDQSRKQGVALANFPHLNLFAQEHRLPTATDSDFDKLVGDAEELDRAVRERLYSSPDQRQLDHYAGLLKIMADMLSISATAKELDYYRAHKAEFSVTALVGFLDNLCYRNAMSSNLDTGVVKLDEYLKLAGQFYEVADKRSDAFVQNLLKQMDRHQQKLAVLITGGFHNPLVEAAFQKRGISFLTVKPRITHTYDENPYFSLLRNRRAPVEELLAQNQNIFAPPSAFNDPVFVKYLTSVLGINLISELMDKSHDSAEFQAEYLSALKAYSAGNPQAIFDFKQLQSNLQKKIYAFPVKGSDKKPSEYSVVLRPSAVVTDNSAYQSFIKAHEDLGNGYEFQIVKTEDLQANRGKILGIEETARARSGWQGLTLRAFTAWQGLKNLRLSWESQAVGSAVLAVALVASMTLTLPAAFLASLQMALVAGVVMFGLFMLSNRQTPAWVKVGSTLGVGMLAAAFTQQAAPWVMNFSQSVAQIFSPTTAGHSGYLGTVGAMMVPLVGMVGNLTGAEKGFGAAVTQSDDLVDRAILFSNQNLGFGKPEFEGTTFRTSVETLVGRLKELSDSGKTELARVRPVLEQAQHDPQLLALLSIVWHQTPETSINAEGETEAEGAKAQTPEEKVLAFANDLAQGEMLAKYVAQGRKIPEQLLQSGNSFLAQLIKADQTGAVKGKKFVLGAEIDGLHPERLMALAVSKNQVQALRQFAESKQVQLSVSGPVFSSVLGYHPEDTQVVEAYKKALDVARALGPQTVLTVPENMTADTWQAVKTAAQHNDEKNLSEVSVAYLGAKFEQASAPVAGSLNAARVELQIQTQKGDEATKPGKTAPVAPVTAPQPKVVEGKKQPNPATTAAGEKKGWLPGWMTKGVGKTVQSQTEPDRSDLIKNAVASASKDINAEVEVESFEAVRRRADKPVSNVEAVGLIGKRIPEIMEVLRKSLNDVQTLKKVEEMLNSLANPASGLLMIRTVESIAGGIAVNTTQHGFFEIIVERQLTGMLKESTIIHEMVEAVLKMQADETAREKAHTLAFIVETALFPESLKAKLANVGRYQDAHLLRLQDTESGEFKELIQTIREQKGVTDFVKQAQEENARKVSLAAREELAARYQSEQILERFANTAAPEAGSQYIYDPVMRQTIIRKFSTEHAYIGEDSTENRELYRETKEIFNNLIQAAKRRLTAQGKAHLVEGLENADLFIADEDESNAYAMIYFNFITINTGLFKELNKNRMLTKDIIAFLLAHELTHLIQYREDVEAGKIEAGLSFKDLDDLIRKKFHEKQKDYGREEDADTRAVNLVNDAGYSVGEITRFFELIAKEKNGLFLALVDEHPVADQRIHDLEKIRKSSNWKETHKTMLFGEQAVAELESTGTLLRRQQQAILNAADFSTAAELVKTAQTAEELELLAARFIFTGKRFFGHEETLSVYNLEERYKGKDPEILNAGQKQILFDQITNRFSELDRNENTRLSLALLTVVFQAASKQDSQEISFKSRLAAEVGGKDTLALLILLEGITMPAGWELENYFRLDHPDADRFFTLSKMHETILAQYAEEIIKALVDRTVGESRPDQLFRVLDILLNKSKEFLNTIEFGQAVDLLVGKLASVANADESAKLLQYCLEHQVLHKNEVVAKFVYSQLTAQPDSWRIRQALKKSPQLQKSVFSAFLSALRNQKELPGLNAASPVIFWEELQVHDFSKIAEAMNLSEEDLFRLISTLYRNIYSGWSVAEDKWLLALEGVARSSSRESYSFSSELYSFLGALSASQRNAVEYIRKRAGEILKQAGIEADTNTMNLQVIKVIYYYGLGGKLGATENWLYDLLADADIPQKDLEIAAQFLNSEFMFSLKKRQGLPESFSIAQVRPKPTSGKMISWESPSPEQIIANPGFYEHQTWAEMIVRFNTLVYLKKAGQPQEAERLAKTNTGNGPYDMFRGELAGGEIGSIQPKVSNTKSNEFKYNFYDAQEAAAERANIFQIRLTKYLEKIFRRLMQSEPKYLDRRDLLETGEHDRDLFGFILQSPKPLGELVAEIKALVPRSVYRNYLLLHVLAREVQSLDPSYRPAKGVDLKDLRKQMTALLRNTKNSERLALALETISPLLMEDNRMNVINSSLLNYWREKRSGKREGGLAANLPFRQFFKGIKLEPAFLKGLFDLNLENKMPQTSFMSRLKAGMARLWKRVMEGYLALEKVLIALLPSFVSNIGKLLAFGGAYFSLTATYGRLVKTPGNTKKEQKFVTDVKALIGSRFTPGESDADIEYAYQQLQSYYGEEMVKFFYRHSWLRLLRVWYLENIVRLPKADIFHFDFQGRQTQLDTSLPDLAQAVIERKINSTDSFAGKRELIAKLFNRQSGPRDRYLEMLAEVELRGASTKQGAALQRVQENVESLLALFGNAYLRDKYAMASLELERNCNPRQFAWTKAPWNALTKQRHFEFVKNNVELAKKYFAPGYMRDDVLLAILETAMTYDEYLLIKPQLYQYKGNVITDEQAMTSVYYEEKLELILQREAGAKEKKDILLWVLGIQPKPLFVREWETTFGVSFDRIKDVFASREKARFASAEDAVRFNRVGESARKEFVRQMFVGDAGILSSDELFNEFMEGVFNKVVPNGKIAKATLKKIMNAVLKNSDARRKVEIVQALSINMAGVFEGAKQNESEIIARFFESLGLIGVKMAQTLAHSYDIPLPAELREALANLSSSADRLSKLTVFETIQNVCPGGFDANYEYIGNELGSASIKIVYEALRKGASEEIALKVKRPAVEQQMDEDLAFLTKVLNDLRAGGLPIPEGMEKRISGAIAEDADFNNEAAITEAFGQQAAEINQDQQFALKNGTSVVFEVAAIAPGSIHNNVTMETALIKGTALGNEKKLVDKGVLTAAELEELKPIIFKFLMIQMFKYGFYLADPHSGNFYIVREAGKLKVVLIDSGSAEKVEKTEANFRNLLEAMVWLSVNPGGNIPHEYLYTSVFFTKTGYLRQHINERQMLGIIFGITHFTAPNRAGPLTADEYLAELSKKIAASMSLRQKLGYGSRNWRQAVPGFPEQAQGKSRAADVENKPSQTGSHAGASSVAVPVAAEVRVEDQTQAPELDKSKAIEVRRADLNQLPEGTLVHYSMDGGHWDYTLRIEGAGRVSVWLRRDFGRVSVPAKQVGNIFSPETSGVLELNKEAVMPYFNQNSFGDGARHLQSIEGGNSFVSAPETMTLQLPEGAVALPQAMVAVSEAEKAAEKNQQAFETLKINLTDAVADQVWSGAETTHAEDSFRQLKRELVMRRAKNLGLSDDEMKGIMQTVVTEARKLPAEELTELAVQEIAGRVLLAGIPQLAQELAVSGATQASKEINGQAEVEPFAAVLARAGSDRISATKPAMFIGEQAGKLKTLLGKSVPADKLPGVLQALSQISLGRLPLSIRTVSGIQGGIGVNRETNGQIVIIIEKMLEGTLRDATIFHEILEAVLTANGVKQADVHAISFIVETELFPQSLELKLRDKNRYNAQSLRLLAKNAASVELTGWNQYVKDKQALNARKVADAAARILAETPAQKDSPFITLSPEELQEVKTVFTQQSVVAISLQGTKETGKALWDGKKINLYPNLFRTDVIGEIMNKSSLTKAQAVAAYADALYQHEFFHRKVASNSKGYYTDVELNDIYQQLRSQGDAVTQGLLGVIEGVVAKFYGYQPGERDQAGKPIFFEEAVANYIESARVTRLGYPGNYAREQNFVLAFNLLLKTLEKRLEGQNNPSSQRLRAFIGTVVGLAQMQDVYRQPARVSLEAMNQYVSSLKQSENPAAAAKVTSAFYGTEAGQALTEYFQPITGKTQTSALPGKTNLPAANTRLRSPEVEAVFQYVLGSPAEQAKLENAPAVQEYKRSLNALAALNSKGKLSMGTDAEVTGSDQLTRAEGNDFIAMLINALVKVNGQRVVKQTKLTRGGLAEYAELNSGWKVFIDSAAAENVEESGTQMPGNIEVASEVLNIQAATAARQQWLQNLAVYMDTVFKAGNPKAGAIGPHFHIGSQEPISKEDVPLWRMAWLEAEGYLLPMLAQITGSTAPALPLKGDFANHANLQSTELGGELGGLAEWVHEGYGNGGEEMLAKYFNFVVKNGVPEFRMRYPVTDPTQLNKAFVLFSAAYIYMQNRVAHAKDQTQGIAEVAEALPFAAYYTKGLEPAAANANLGKFASTLNFIIGSQLGDKKNQFFDVSALQSYFTQQYLPTIARIKSKAQDPLFAEQYHLDAKILNPPVDYAAVLRNFKEIAELRGYSYGQRQTVGTGFFGEQTQKALVSLLEGFLNSAGTAQLGLGTVQSAVDLAKLTVKGLFGNLSVPQRAAFFASFGHKVEHEYPAGETHDLLAKALGNWQATLRTGATPAQVKILADTHKVLAQLQAGQAAEFTLNGEQQQMKQVQIAVIQNIKDTVITAAQAEHAKKLGAFFGFDPATGMGTIYVMPGQALQTAALHEFIEFVGNNDHEAVQTLQDAVAAVSEQEPETGAASEIVNEQATLTQAVNQFKTADPKILHQGARDLADLKNPEHTAATDVYAQTDVDTRPVFQSYAFKADDASAYRIWTGERVAVTVPQNAKVVLGSTDFSSCAAAVIHGFNARGERVLELAHLEASGEKGQLPRLQESLSRLRKQGVTQLQVFVHIDPVNAPANDEYYHNIWPADNNEIQTAVGNDVQLTVDRKSLDAKGQPEITSVYATEQGVAVEYAKNPSIKPKFIAWSQGVGQAPAQTAAQGRVGKLAFQARSLIQHIFTHPAHGPAVQSLLDQYPETSRFLQTELRLTGDENAQLESRLEQFLREPKKGHIKAVVEVLNQAHSGRTVSEFIRIMTLFATQAALAKGRTQLSPAEAAGLATADGQDRFALFSAGSMTRQGESALKSDVDLVWLSENGVGAELGKLKIAVAAQLNAWGYEADPTAMQYTVAELANWKEKTEFIRQVGFLGTRFAAGNPALRQTMEKLQTEILLNPKFLFDNASVANVYLNLLEPRELREPRNPGNPSEVRQVIAGMAKQNLIDVMQLIANVSALEGTPLYSLDQALASLGRRGLLQKQDRQALLEAYDYFVQSRIQNGLEAPAMTVNEITQAMDQAKRMSAQAFQAMKRIYRPLQARHLDRATQLLHRYVTLVNTPEPPAGLIDRINQNEDIKDKNGKIQALKELWRDIQSTPIPTLDQLNQWTSRVKSMSAEVRSYLFDWMSKHELSISEEDVIVATARSFSEAGVNPKVSKNVASALRAAGLSLDKSTGVATLNTADLRKRVAAALVQITSEKTAIESKTVRQPGDALILANYEQAQNLLNRIARSLPMQAVLPFTVMVSAAMNASQLGATTIARDRIILNAGYMERFSAQDALKALKLILHEASHIASMGNDEEGEIDAYILGRLAAGYQMGIMDVVREQNKIGSKYVAVKSSAAAASGLAFSGAARRRIEATRSTSSLLAKTAADELPGIVAAENNLGILPHQEPSLTNKLTEAFSALSHFQPGTSAPASLDLIPGFFRITSQLSSTLHRGLLNVLWSGLLALPMGGAVWSTVLGLLGPTLRAGLVEQAVIRVREISSPEDAEQVLEFVTTMAAIPGMEVISFKIPEGNRTLNIPSEIFYRPALLHRLLSPVLNGSPLQLQPEQQNFNSFNSAA
jgi:hypothetical protein